MSYIQTRSGRRFDLLRPNPDTVDIGDIAHALSQICRFTGHTKSFISVAQHSVVVSRLCHEYPLHGLLHDAPEAYYGDVSTPLKRVLGDDLKRVMEPIDAAVWEHFGLDWEGAEHPVKAADLRSLATERRDCMVATTDKWPGLPSPTRQRVVPVGPQEACEMFMARFRELTNDNSKLSRRRSLARV